jgi:hypothetical protein
LLAVVAAQLAFTYVPFMQGLFKTEAVAPLDGALIVGVGVALLVVVEVEKRIVSFLWARKTGRAAKHGTGVG